MLSTMYHAQTTPFTGQTFLFCSVPGAHHIAQGKVIHIYSVRNLAKAPPRCYARARWDRGFRRQNRTGSLTPCSWKWRSTKWGPPRGLPPMLMEYPRRNKQEQQTKRTLPSSGGLLFRRRPLGVGYVWRRGRLDGQLFFACCVNWIC